MAGGRYEQLLRVPHVGAMTAAALLARLPLGIVGLALVLFFREQTGSYATAGAVAAAFAVGSAVASPAVSRTVDRRGAPRVLLPLCAIHATGLVVVIVLGYADAPGPACGFVAFVSGAAMPPISAVMRTLWPGLLAGREDLVTTAFALDAVVVELVFVSGPLTVALLTAIAAPAAALGLSAVVALAGTLLFATRPPARAHEPGPRPAGRALDVLRAPGLQTLVLGTLPLGFTLGSTEVILPAFAETEGHRALAGVLLATWTIGSAAGGIVYGARGHTRALADRVVLYTLLVPTLLLPLALAPSLPVMLLMVLPAGAIIAPALAATNQLVADVAPSGRRTEAYSWPLTALVLGVATGNAAGGAIVEAADWRTAFVVAGLVGLSGGAVLLARKGTLRAPVA